MARLGVRLRRQGADRERGCGDAVRSGVGLPVTPVATVHAGAGERAGRPVRTGLARGRRGAPVRRGGRLAGRAQLRGGGRFRRPSRRPDARHLLCGKSGRAAGAGQRGASFRGRHGPHPGARDQEPARRHPRRRSAPQARRQPGRHAAGPGHRGRGGPHPPPGGPGGGLLRRARVRQAAGEHPPGAGPGAHPGGQRLRRRGAVLR